MSNHLLTPPILRTLAAMSRHGYADRTKFGSALSDWKWTVGGENTNGAVDRLVQRGLAVVVGAERNRVVLTDRGKRLVP